MGLSSKQVSTDAQEWAEQSLLQATPVKQQNQQKEPPLKCPRCDSMNTKFCYYNNYNKSQPRYYCKSCKRHWTNGGNLRDVPVGGNRRNKRLKTTKHCQEETETELLTSTPSLPFSLPNFSFATAENTPSSSSTYISGVFQATDDLYGSSFVANDSASVPLSCSTSAVDSLSDWSWDEFNALISAGMRQQWDDFETEIPTN